MRKLGSRAMEEKARIRKMDPGIFFMQVLDFYRRPMLYYYNDCEYVHFQHGGLRGRNLRIPARQS